MKQELLEKSIFVCLSNFTFSEHGFSLEHGTCILHVMLFRMYYTGVFLVMFAGEPIEACTL